MPKYIDAEALKMLMVFSPTTGNLTVPEMRDILTIIDSAPSADVEPVRYGQWVKTTGMAPPEFAGSYHCSECGWHGRSRKEREYKRCPECGAKMNEGEQR